jgi:Protein of unknown function (DUF4038)/Putative collagen-binding domain of a collagenase
MGLKRSEIRKAKRETAGRRRNIGWRTLLAIWLPTVVFVLLGLEGGIGSGEEQQQIEPDITASSNGRYFVDPAGDPFFWLADTAWGMPVDLDRDQVAEYFDTRAKQGFNVVQVVAIFNQAGGPGPNRYGDHPYADDLSKLAVTDGADPDNPEQYDFWDHLDYIVEQANGRGIRVALVPIWGHKLAGTVLTDANAFDYGKFVGSRYRKSQMVWVLGGDTSATGAEGIWANLARGIATGVTGAEDYKKTLMTYHPVGGSDSLQWFANAPWLGFDMAQGGHCLRYTERRAILDAAYRAAVTRPFLDGEQIYSEHPRCWRPEDGYSTPLDVRRDAYWAAFAGAAGVTYGHHSVWQFAGATGLPPELGAIGDWESALEDGAAWQMHFLADLMSSHPWYRGLPDQKIITSPIVDGPSRPQAFRASDGSYAMVYSPDGGPLAVDLSVLTGSLARLSWFDPSTGEYTQLGVEPKGPATYVPPTTDDWVLVADAVPNPTQDAEPSAPCLAQGTC